MIFLCTAFLWAAEPRATVIKKELDRNLLELALPDQERPYFIGATVTTDEYWQSKAHFGALIFHEHPLQSRMTVDVRVGNAQFDNRNFMGGFSNSWRSSKIPVEMDAHLIRKDLWLLCDQAYKNAVEEYSDKIASFPNPEQREGIDMLPMVPSQQNLSRSVEVKDLSPLSVRLSRYHPRGWEDLSVYTLDRKRDIHFLSTEGSDIQQTERYSVLHVEGVRKAEDGTDVVGHRWWIVKDPRQLPPEQGLRQEIAELSDWLTELQAAEIEKDYLGPVLFEPDAAAELFRQLLPKQISGTPPEREAPSEYEATISFSSAREGRRLFEGNWKVEDLPRRVGLMGSYRFDYEGVEAQNMTLIKKGVLVDVLMSRTPRTEKKHSTGHARGSIRGRMTAMPSNVLITPPKRHKMSKLRKKALKLSRQVGNDYVLVVRKLTPLELHDSLEIAFSGDAPLSGLSAPLEMVRLYRDGREVPVRGAKFFGVDRRVFRDIVMAGPQSDWMHMIDEPPFEMRFDIGFFGYGTSWSAPAVLISEMELRGGNGGEKRKIPPPY
jgi:hypothetical protein